MTIDGDEAFSTWWLANTDFAWGPEGSVAQIPVEPINWISKL